MDTPKLGEVVCDGEAIVVAMERLTYERAGQRPWFVLAVRPDNDADQPLHSYVTWKYLGDGRVTEGSYHHDFMPAVADLHVRAHVSLAFPPNGG